MKRLPVLFGLSIIVFVGIQWIRHPTPVATQRIEDATIGNQVTALHRMGTMLYVGFGDGRISQWQLEPRQKIMEFMAHDGAIRRIRSGAQSDEVITVGARGSVAEWDKDFNLIKRHRFIDRHLNDGIVLDSGALMVAGDKGYIARVGTQPWRIVGMHNLAVFGLALDPRTQTVLSVGSDGQVGIWSTKTGDKLGYVGVGKDWLHTINRFDDSLWVGDINGKLHLIELDTRSVKTSLDIGTARVITTASDGHLLALGSQDGRLTVLDTQSHKIIYSAQPFKTPIYAIEFYDGGLVLGTSGPTMRFMPDYDKPAILDF